MNILLLGSGGREHALAWKIADSPLIERYTLRLLRNPGIAWGAIKPLGERAVRHFPSQSVLSPAGTQE